eukprot:Plantae.Rhodophyta-Hildenbrandia_rubra.ctg12479.p1 GENE.Plantae.Rhodophyta-Hildenbrandia_rubra.ctg12479~~Plantae.Rhodophyta-Hildenbrandia_rubra.ctg12479.p1  ORF type:complete len:605 (+),score=102.09 Plantae.Rhodophyta-Hildenbrandia_rubra.ctg12479:28-1842(+)
MASTRPWLFQDHHYHHRCYRQYFLLIIILVITFAYQVDSVRTFRYISRDKLGARLIALSHRYKSMISLRGENCTSRKECHTIIAQFGATPASQSLSSKPEVLIVVASRLGFTIGYELLRVLAEGSRKDMWLRKLGSERKVTVVFSGEGEDLLGRGFGKGCKVEKNWRGVVEKILEDGLVRIVMVFKELEESNNEIVYVKGDDDVAAEQIAQHLKTFSGEFKGKSFVVRGLETHQSDFERQDGLTLSQWAYWGSRGENSTENVAGCSKRDNGIATMPAPNNVTHRALSFVVNVGAEPVEEDLGNSAGLYEKSAGLGNGFVPINVRAALLAIDAAEPYVFFLRHENGKPGISLSGSILRAKWSVGGAFEVMKTYLECTLEDGSKFQTPEQEGGSMWGVNHGVAGYEDRFVQSDGVWLGFKRERIAKWAYSDRILLMKTLPKAVASQGVTLTVRAVAKVDQHWLNSTTIEGRLDLTPRSHLARSRLDEEWFAKNKKALIEGKVLFYSPSVAIDVPPLSGWYAIVDYAWEMISIALLICVAPPLVLILYWRNWASVSSRSRAAVGVARQRIRRGLRRMFSRGDLKEEVRLMNTERRRSTNAVQRSWHQ